MNRLEEIKNRRQEYLDSIRNYVGGEHEEKRDEFLYYSEQDIEYLLLRLERYELALKHVRDYERLEENWKAATFIDEVLKE